LSENNACFSIWLNVCFAPKADIQVYKVLFGSDKSSKLQLLL